MRKLSTVGHRHIGDLVFHCLAFVIVGVVVEINLSHFPSCRLLYNLGVLFFSVHVDFLSTLLAFFAFQIFHFVRKRMKTNTPHSLHTGKQYWCTEYTYCRLYIIYNSYILSSFILFTILWSIRSWEILKECHRIDLWREVLQFELSFLQKRR